MKKIFINLILFICIICCYEVHAETKNNGYIVKMKDTAISLMCVSDEISHVVDNLYRTDDIASLYNFIAPEDIEAIFPDYEFELFDGEYPVTTSDSNFNEQWYLDTIGAVSIREKGLSGEGVKIAVIDSGVNALHPDFNQSNILQGYNCTFGATDINDYSDNVGHGTMVAGIIAAQTDNERGISGIASNAQIIPIKITDTGKLNISSIFLGLEKAIETDCDIINMSFGGAITDQDALSVLKGYIDEAEEKGIIVVAAVGNSGHTDNYMNYPAGFDNVIGVGSVNEDLTVSYFSQKNDSVFISAPGNNIVSLFNANSVKTDSGTSFSTPIVTAVLAVIKEVNPNCSLQELKELFIKTSDDAGTEGYDVNYGYGILNVNNIIKELDDQIPEFLLSQGVLNSKLRIHIHNNSNNTVKANGFFTTYNDGRLDKVEMVEDISLSSGVTSISNQEMYECFFLWDSNLRPYVSGICCQCTYQNYNN